VPKAAVAEGQAVNTSKDPKPMHRSIIAPVDSVRQRAGPCRRVARVNSRGCVCGWLKGLLYMKENKRVCCVGVCLCFV